MTELSKFFEDHSQVHYIMYGGKGGIGKTTFSAATAFYLAKNGFKVLVFSVDPQASLSDIFERNIYGRGEIEIMPNLFACEVDADNRIKQYQDEIRQKILNMYGMEKIPDEIENYIQAASAEPAMEESAIFDAVVDLVSQAGYDYYIYDLVPLGHALYYLSMASIYDAWINKITGLREKMRDYDKVISTIKHQKELTEDQILNELTYIKNRINKASAILTDPNRTAFFFILTPEEMVILDTLRAAELFRKFAVPIRGYIVNRVLPADLFTQNSPPYLKSRMAMQQKFLQQIDQKFGALAHVPEFEREIKGLDMIERIADQMFGGP